MQTAHDTAPQWNIVAIFSGILSITLVLVFVFLHKVLSLYVWFLLIPPIFTTVIATFLVSKSLREKTARLKQSAVTSAFYQEEDKQYQEILKHLSDGLIITTNQNAILMINFSALRMLAVKEEEVINYPITKLLPIQEYLNRPTENLPLQIRNGVNDLLDLAISINPMFDRAQLKGCIYTLKNMTEHNKFEKVKLDFVAQVAHQLRTPLSISRNYLFMLARKANEKLNDQERMYLERANSGIERLGGLIDNLLNIARIERNELVPQFKQASLDEVISKALERAEHYASQKNIEIIFQHPSQQLPFIEMDPLLIGEVLNNLLENSVDFSKEGSRVELSVQKTDHEINVNVKDYGLGIPSDSIDKLFNKFFKVTDQLKQTSQGIGLGLFNAKAIIDSHHGKIWVNSLLGKGSTFSFSLPI